MSVFRYIVTDVDDSVRFYTDSLGFELEANYGPAMAIVTRDDLTLWLAGPSASASVSMRDGSKPTAGGWNRIVLEVENLVDYVGELKTRGVTFRNDIVK